jgi:hypothetical protein
LVEGATFREKRELIRLRDAEVVLKRLIVVCNELLIALNVLIVAWLILIATSLFFPVREAFISAGADPAALASWIFPAGWVVGVRHLLRRRIEGVHVDTGVGKVPPAPRPTFPRDHLSVSKQLE